MIDKKAEEAQIISCLSWDIPLLLPLDINTLGPWVFVHAFSGIGVWAVTTSVVSRVFSYRLHIVGLLSLYMSQSLIVNLFLFIYLSYWFCLSGEL